LPLLHGYTVDPQTTVPFDKPGAYNVLAVSKIEGQDVGAAGSVTVTAKDRDAFPTSGNEHP